MAGIAGIITAEPSDQASADLDRMLAVMQHTPRYVTGRLTAEDERLCVGWTALDAVRGRTIVRRTHAGELELVLSGEHHANANGGANLQDALGEYGHQPERFLRELNGWFCGALVNHVTHEITLFNDRFGMGRLYYAEGDGEFLFASEAKALLAVRPRLRTIDVEALAQHLRLTCVTSDRSLFKGVSLLPAGSAWTFRGGVAPSRRRYFDFTEWEELPTLPSEEFGDRFADVMTTVVPRYLSDVGPVGLSITSGLDTRAILAGANGNSHPPCYTFGGLWGETFDIRTGRKAAELSGFTHHAIRIDERFFREFPRLARESVYVSDGTHDALGAHDVFFNEEAYAIAPVRLTGKFGSEIVRVRRLIPWGDFPRGLVQPELHRHLDAVPRLEAVTRHKHPLTRVVCEEIPWYEYGRVSVEQSRVVLRTPYMDNDLVRLMYQAPAGIRKTRNLQVNYIKARRPDLAELATNLGQMGADQDLRGRVSYLLLWSLFKFEYFYLYSTPHWLTRVDRVFDPLRPERFLTGRQKFEGYRHWLRRELADYVAGTLLSTQASWTTFFRPAEVTRMVREHLAGSHNHWLEINKVLTVELICSSLLKNVR